MDEREMRIEEIQEFLFDRGEPHSAPDSPYADACILATKLHSTCKFLLSEVRQLQDTLKKYQRREDVHCRQIEELSKTCTLLARVAEEAEKVEKFAPTSALETVLEAARDKK